MKKIIDILFKTLHSILNRYKLDPNEIKVNNNYLGQHHQRHRSHNMGYLIQDFHSYLKDCISKLSIALTNKIIL